MKHVMCITSFPPIIPILQMMTLELRDVRVTQLIHEELGLKLRSGQACVVSVLERGWHTAELDKLGPPFVASISPAGPLYFWVTIKPALSPVPSHDI